MPGATGFSFLGIGKETTKGTAVTATHYIPTTSHDGDDTVDVLMDQGMRGSMATSYGAVKGTTQATGRPVVVRRLLVDHPDVVHACDAVYIGKLSTDERSRLFDSLIGHPVLSISEGGDQCTVGSLFCLRVGDEQVSFEVNLDSVARSGVRIHPSVLQLSRRRAPAS